MNIVRWNRPALSAWPSFGGLSTLRNEIDRLFDAPLTELARASQFLSGATPAVDVFEDKENFVVKAELPGMKKEDIDVSLHDGALSISGERTEEKVVHADMYNSEHVFDPFQRSEALPASDDAKKLKAQPKDGVLPV